MFAIGDEAWPGLSKLAEECGEVVQVIGKLMGTRGEEQHWDGTNLTERLLEEMADVDAAVAFVLAKNPYTPGQRMQYYKRYVEKLELFEEWHQHEDPPPSRAKFHEPVTWPDAMDREMARDALEGGTMRSTLKDLVPGKIMEAPPEPQIKHTRFFVNCEAEGWHKYSECGDQDRIQIRGA